MKLHQELLELRQTEKRITSEILTKLQEMENCRGYLKMGHSSLVDYLVRGLGYSEATAYQRQACVRLAREIPEIREKIDSGDLSLTAISTAYKHLRGKPIGEKRHLLKSIENRSSREVKKMFLEPMTPLKIQKTEYADKVYLRLELTHEQNQRLEKLKALRSHKHSIESLLVEFIEKELKNYENTKFKLSNSKNPRQIPKRLRNSVLKSSGYKCQFPGCESKYFLQIDHIHPVRRGGKQNPENLQVLCATHNQQKG